MKLLQRLRHRGLSGSLDKAMDLFWLNSGCARWRYRGFPVYSDPSPGDLASIERELASSGVEVVDYSPPVASFKAFQSAGWFPDNYHGGRNGRVWTEKLVEHWIASDLLNLANFRKGDIYLDVAAGQSPWAKSLRERLGTEACAISLSEFAPPYGSLPYYRVEDATSTSFADSSVAGASLQCAFEMFVNDDDTRLVREAARILKPGGKLVIVPLYMHTHYCAYSSPEYFGKGHSDPMAKEYVRLDSRGVPSSRKYNVEKLKQRVLLLIEALGMQYRLMALRNGRELGPGVYCHFILEIRR